MCLHRKKKLIPLIIAAEKYNIIHTLCSYRLMSKFRPKGYYSILGVPSDSLEDDIRAAFKQLSYEYHPDRGGDIIMVCILYIYLGKNECRFFPIRTKKPMLSLNSQFIFVFS